MATTSIKASVSFLLLRDGPPLSLPPQKEILMATTADISRGLIVKLDGSLYTVVEFGENKTARAAAKVWAKLKGVDNNRSIEKTWNSGDNIYPVRVERKSYQFLYKDDTGYNFMDTETFEQVALQENMVDAPQFLKDGQCKKLCSLSRCCCKCGHTTFQSSHALFKHIGGRVHDAGDQM